MLGQASGQGFEMTNSHASSKDAIFAQLQKMIRPTQRRPLHQVMQYSGPKPAGSWPEISEADDSSFRERLNRLQQNTVQPLITRFLSAALAPNKQGGGYQESYLFGAGHGAGHGTERTIKEQVSDLVEQIPLLNQVEVFNQVEGYLAELDERWQVFVHTRVDPLLGGRRSEQLGELGIQMSASEKEMNRRLLLSAGNIGVAWIATHLFPPLALINAGMMVWLGEPIYGRGWRALRDEKRLTYPVVLAGAAATLIISGQYVPGSVMMFVLTATRKVVNRTEDHFRRNIVDALGQQPRTVWRVRPDVIPGQLNVPINVPMSLGNEIAVETPLAEIKHGDILLVGAGETLAVDGVILEGFATIDQHRLTGEAQPAEKTVGDEVLASTLVLSGKIQVCVRKTGQETSAAQIATILQSVSRNRISFTSKLDNFADSMTAPMLALGGVALLAMGPVSAAAIMSIGVGSVARLGGPLATLNYLNVAAGHGVLIKDARSFEVLKQVNTFVFDKTGTLTLEQPELRNLHLCLADSMFTSCAHVAGQGDDLGGAAQIPGQTQVENLLLALAAAAETRQSHPIARAIVAAAQERNLTIPEVEHAHVELGYGIKVRLPTQQVEQMLARESLLAPLLQAAPECRILVGSRRFLEMEGIPLPAELAAVQDACHDQGHSLVLVAINGRAVGALEMQPTVRPEARQTIAALRRQGMAVYIISGDHDAPTRQLAHSLGIEHYFAGVLPQQKAQIVEELKAKGCKICFVGDGINDAIAMGKADVSVSLRGASTLATDTAQIVLMNENLASLRFMLHLADEFDRSLVTLFRATFVPVGAVVASTFLLQTGVYAALIVWQLGVASGLGLGFWPLIKYRDSSRRTVSMRWARLRSRNPKASSHGIEQENTRLAKSQSTTNRVANRLEENQ